MQGFLVSQGHDPRHWFLAGVQDLPKTPPQENQMLPLLSRVTRASATPSVPTPWFGAERGEGCRRKQVEEVVGRGHVFGSLFLLGNVRIRHGEGKWDKAGLRAMWPNWALRLEGSHTRAMSGASTAETSRHLAL